MRELLVAGLLATGWSVGAQAQDASEFTSPVGAPPPSVRLLVEPGPAGQTPPLGPVPTRRCCSLKGALIGAGVGAAIGFGFARLCDAGDCTSGYIKYMVVLGGVGAGIGVMTASPSHESPLLPLGGPGIFRSL